MKDRRQNEQTGRNGWDGQGLGVSRGRGPSANGDSTTTPGVQPGVSHAPIPGPGSAQMGGVVDRRLGLDRREMASASEGEDATGLERRRGAGRRRTDFMKAAEEGEMTPEQFHFLAAIDAFKKGNNKMFPTWTDVLEVVRLLGYRKTMPSELNLRNVEDWRERADTPSGVRSKPGHPEQTRRLAA